MPNDIKRFPEPGLNHVGSYQVAGQPWITSSILTADTNSGSIITYLFPRVTKRVRVQLINPYHSIGIHHNTASHGGQHPLRTKALSDNVYVFFGSSPGAVPYIEKRHPSGAASMGSVQYSTDGAHVDINNPRNKNIEFRAGMVNGKNIFNNWTYKEKPAAATATSLVAPQLSRGHAICLNSSAASGSHIIDMDIRTDHVHIAVVGGHTVQGGHTVASLAVTGTFEVYAELTNIRPERMYPLTGSGIDE